MPTYCIHYDQTGDGHIISVYEMNEDTNVWTDGDAYTDELPTDSSGQFRQTDWYVTQKGSHFIFCSGTKPYVAAVSTAVLKNSESSSTSGEETLSEETLWGEESLDGTPSDYNYPLEVYTYEPDVQEYQEYINEAYGGSFFPWDEETLTEDVEEEFVEEESFVDLDDTTGDIDPQGTSITGNSTAEAGSSGGTETNGVVGVVGDGTICAITLKASEWLVRTNDNVKKYVYEISVDGITPSTVLYLLSINRDALNADLEWISGEGRILFLTSIVPASDVVIACVLTETGDYVTASGKIDKFPQAHWKCVHYTANVASGDSLSIAAGRSKRVIMPLDFADATLLFVTPEWTGGTKVFIPNVYLYSDANKKLCATLTNIGSEAVEISSLKFLIAYSGNLSGITEAQEREASAGSAAVVSGYITEEDIDEL